MIWSWLLYLACLLGALVFYLFYFGWFAWFTLLLALCIPWFSLLVSLPAMLKARLELTLPESCLQGTPLEAELRFARQTLPLPGCRLRLQLQCMLTGEQTRLTRRLKERGACRIPVDTAHCGLFRTDLGGSLVYDYLGLFCLPLKKRGGGDLLVLPQPVPPAALPNLNRFLVRRRRPKPGGGFAEEHELRDYRPGDSLRDIHWKLSAKTDRLILREAQEPESQRVLLTFDLCRPGKELDSVLAQLLWLSQWLLEHGVEHDVVWCDPRLRRPTVAAVRQEEDLQPLLRQILTVPLAEDLPSLAEHRFHGVTWRYHIRPEGEVRP